MTAGALSGVALLAAADGQQTNFAMPAPSLWAALTALDDKTTSAEARCGAATLARLALWDGDSPPELFSAALTWDADRILASAVYCEDRTTVTAVAQAMAGLAKSSCKAGHAVLKAYVSAFSRAMQEGRSSELTQFVHNLLVDWLPFPAAKPVRDPTDGDGGDGGGGDGGDSGGSSNGSVSIGDKLGMLCNWDYPSICAASGSKEPAQRLLWHIREGAREALEAHGPEAAAAACIAGLRRAAAAVGQQQQASGDAAGTAWSAMDGEDRSDAVAGGWWYGKGEDTRLVVHIVEAVLGADELAGSADIVLDAMTVLRGSRCRSGSGLKPDQLLQTLRRHAADRAVQDACWAVALQQLLAVIAPEPAASAAEQKQQSSSGGGPDATLATPALIARDSFRDSFRSEGALGDIIRALFSRREQLIRGGDDGGAAATLFDCATRLLESASVEEAKAAAGSFSPPDLIMLAFEALCAYPDRDAARELACCKAIAATPFSAPWGEEVHRRVSTEIVVKGLGRAVCKPLHTATVSSQELFLRAAVVFGGPWCGTDGIQYPFRPCVCGTYDGICEVLAEALHDPVTLAALPTARTTLVECVAALTRADDNTRDNDYRSSFCSQLVAGGAVEGVVAAMRDCPEAVELSAAGSFALLALLRGSPLSFLPKAKAAGADAVFSAALARHAASNDWVAEYAPPVLAMLRGKPLPPCSRCGACGWSYCGGHRPPPHWPAATNTGTAAAWSPPPPPQRKNAAAARKRRQQQAGSSSAAAAALLSPESLRRRARLGRRRQRLRCSRRRKQKRPPPRQKQIKRAAEGKGQKKAKSRRRRGGGGASADDGAGSDAAAAVPAAAAATAPAAAAGIRLPPPPRPAALAAQQPPAPLLVAPPPGAAPDAASSAAVDDDDERSLRPQEEEKAQAPAAQQGEQQPHPGARAAAAGGGARWGACRRLLLLQQVLPPAPPPAAAEQRRRCCRRSSCHHRRCPAVCHRHQRQQQHRGSIGARRLRLFFSLRHLWCRLLLLRLLSFRRREVEARLRRLQLLPCQPSCA